MCDIEHVALELSHEWGVVGFDKGDLKIKHVFNKVMVSMESPVLNTGYAMLGLF